MSSSKTKLHNRGDRTPVLWTAPHHRSLQSFSCMRGCNFPATQHRTNTQTDRGSKPMRLVTFIVVSDEALSKDPSISRKAPSKTSLFFTASLSCVITCCIAVSVDFPGWYANWYRCRCRSFVWGRTDVWETGSPNWIFEKFYEAWHHRRWFRRIGMRTRKELAEPRRL